MNPKVSIIVPIYNVDSYLGDCINSVLDQTFTCFELILVNDGSTDASGEICEKYKATDDRIKVIHKENGGVSSARNMGLSIAAGEYIAFVDPDDTVNHEMYEKMYHTANFFDAEMVICPIKTVDLVNNTISVSTVWENINCIIDKNSIEKNIIPLILQNKNYSLVSSVNKLYKRTLFGIHNIKFDENKSHSEDARLNFQLITILQNLVYIGEPLYNYYLRDRGSLSRVFRKDLYEYISDNKGFLVEIAKRYNLNEYIDQIRDHFTGITMSYLNDVVNSALSKKEKHEILSRILNDNCFTRDAKVYHAPTIYFQSLKFACNTKNERLLYEFINLKGIISRLLYWRKRQRQLTV